MAQALQENDHEDWLNSLETCGMVTKVVECAICGEFKHPVRFRCKLKICVSCARRKAKEIRRHLLPYLKELRDLKLLTLTIRNSPNVGEAIDRLRRAFRRLRQRKEIALRLHGGVYAIETTIGQDGLWHVHLHAVVSMFYINQARLSELWCEITGDPVVDIRAVRSPRRALRYITEYLSKGIAHMLEKWPAERVIQYLEVTIKHRLIHTIGALHGIAFPRKKLVCPICNGSIFVLRDMTGRVVFDQVEHLRRLAFDTS